MIDNLPTGKLKPELLESLLSGYQIDDPAVIIGPKAGEDAAVIDIGESYLVAKTDPITFATDEIGWYLVCVNGNDIATMGAKPRWLLVTILLPEGETSEAMVREIFSQIVAACGEFDITLCGGHTEITHNLDRPVAVGQMLGLVEKERLVTSSGAQVDDDILLIKGVAVEAVSLIAREREAELLNRGYSPQYIEKAKDFLKRPGISVLREAMIATEVGGIHAMHDPTEGGLATGLNEMAKCSQVGMTVWPEKINIFPECEKLCAEFGIDPLGVIASGGLLIAAETSYSARILDSLAENNIHCSIIGRAVAPEEGICFQEEQGRYPIPVFESDEITRIFGKSD